MFEHYFRKCSNVSFFNACLNIDFGIVEVRVALVKLLKVDVGIVEILDFPIFPIVDRVGAIPCQQDLRPCLVAIVEYHGPEFPDLTSIFIILQRTSRRGPLF